MDKTLRNVMIAGIIIAILSIGYYFVLKPKTEFEACYNKCTNLHTSISAPEVCFATCAQNK